MPKLRRLFVSGVVVLACSIGPTAVQSLQTTTAAQAVASKQSKDLASARVVEARILALRKIIVVERRATWSWQRAALLSPTPTSYSERRLSGVGYLAWSLRLWKKRHARWQRFVQHPAHMKMWLCIHSREASWKDHASHNPHYGGLQMGWWFMQTYALKLLELQGTADHWTPLQQIWVAERAYARESYSRAWLFGQWGATAPPCVR